MSRLINSALLTKTIIFLLAITLLPLALLAYTNIQSSEQALTDVANQALSISAAQTAERIDLFLLENLQAVQVTGQLREMSGYLNLSEEERVDSPEGVEVARTLRILSQQNQTFLTSFALLDREGINVFDTNQTGAGADESEQLYFNVPIETGSAYVSPILFLSGSTRQASFYFSAPVYNVAGQVIGVLRARVNAAQLQEFIFNTADSAGLDSFGMLLDENQLIIGHATNSALLFKTLTLLPDAEFNSLQAMQQLPVASAENLTVGLDSFATSLENIVEQPIFTTELHSDLDHDDHDDDGGDDHDMVAAVELEQAPWVLVMAQPQDVFLQPVGEQTRQTLFLVSVIAVAVIIAAVVAGRSLAVPIAEMTKSARQIASGDLTVSVPVVSSDERGQLAIAFNEMTAQLRELVVNLEQRVMDRTQALDASARVSRSLSTILDPDQLVIEVVEQVKQAFNYYHAHIYIFDEQNEVLEMAGGTGQAGRAMLAANHKIAKNKGLVGRAAVTNEVVHIPDVSEDKDWLPNELLPDTKSEAAIPIAIGDEVIGVLDVQHDVVNGLTNDDVTLLQSIADQVAIALRNARAYAEAQTQASREAVINDIGRRIQMATDIDAVLQIAARELGKSLGQKRVDVQLGNSSTQNGRNNQ